MPKWRTACRKRSHNGWRRCRRARLNAVAPPYPPERWVRSRIAGTGSYLPAKCVTNAELAQSVDTNDEWIVARTGIRARHIAAEGEMTSDLALAASRIALEAAGLAPEEVDLIVVATT